MQEDMKMIPEFRGYDIHDTKKHTVYQNRNLLFFSFDRRKLYLVNLDLPNSFENPVLFNPFICIIFLELGTCIAVGPKYFLSVSSIFKDRWKIYPSWLCLFWGIKLRSGFSLALCKLKYDWSLAIKMLLVIKIFLNYLDWTLLLVNFCFKCKVRHIHFRCLFHCWIIRIKACLFSDVYILCLCCVPVHVHYKNHDYTFVILLKSFCPIKI